MLDILVWIVVAGAVWLLVRSAQVFYYRQQARYFSRRIDELLIESGVLRLQVEERRIECVELQLQLDVLVAKKRAITLNLCELADVAEPRDEAGRKLRQVH